MRKLNFHTALGSILCIIPVAMFISCKKSVSIKTIPPTEVMSSTTVSGGELQYDNRISIYETGICYSTQPEPTQKGQHIKAKFEPRTFKGGFESGTFKVVLTGLLGNTTYYVRAYAESFETGADGLEVHYGKEVSFKTTTSTIPVISTNNNSEGEYGGHIISDGGSPVTEKGICYGITPLPTTGDKKIITNELDESGFFALKPDFKTGTVYYVRAYAINQLGTAYGKEVIVGVNNYVCSGNGWKAAIPYDPSKKGIHPLICNFDCSYPSEWISATVEQAELLVCRTQRKVYYTTCYYTNNIDIKKYYEEETYTIREIATGRVISKKTFQGVKNDCSESIHYDSKVPTWDWVSTSPVDKNKVESWIKSFVVK